jgi:hypothetical protein
MGRECGGEMEAGFIADVSEATVLQQTWVRASLKRDGLAV